MFLPIGDAVSALVGSDKPAILGHRGSMDLAREAERPLWRVPYSEVIPKTVTAIEMSPDTHFRELKTREVLRFFLCKLLSIF